MARLLSHGNISGTKQEENMIEHIENLTNEQKKQCYREGEND